MHSLSLTHLKCSRITKNVLGICINYKIHLAQCRTEAVPTTYGFLNLVYVFASRHHALAITAGSDLGFMECSSRRYLNNYVSKERSQNTYGTPHTSNKEIDRTIHDKFWFIINHFWNLSSFWIMLNYIVLWIMILWMLWMVQKLFTCNLSAVFKIYSNDL